MFVERQGGYKEGVERYMLIGPRSEGIDPFIEKIDTSLNKNKGVFKLFILHTIFIAGSLFFHRVPSRLEFQLQLVGTKA